MTVMDELFGRSKGSDKVRFKIIKENPRFKKFEDKRSSERIASSVAYFSSEVVVKVSGYTKSGSSATGKGASPVSAHINYISRNGDITIETDKGELITGKSCVKEFCQDWQSSIDATRTSENSRDVMHLVLSMPGKNDTEKMRNAIREFASTTFGHNHEYIFVMHTDTENTHGHLAVRCRGFNGRQMQMGPGVAQEWRVAFAALLREQDIHAEATPRSYRGVVRKAEKQVFRHMERPDPMSGRKPRIPEVKKKQVQEILEELKGMSEGIQPKKNEIAEKAKHHAQKIKEIWLQTAKEIEKHGVPPQSEEMKLAEQIRRFVKNMPEIKTRHELMMEKIMDIGTRNVLKSTRGQGTQPKSEKEASEFER